MKRLFLLLSLCSALSLAGCGVSQSEYDELLKENSSLQAQVEELQAEAEKAAAESFEITEGDLYDSVLEIYPNIVLTDLGEDISITISFDHQNELDDSTMFFYVVSQILETSKLEDHYSGVSFLMRVEDSLVAIFTLLDYVSPSSFTSSEPTVLKDNYKESIEMLYSIGFSSSDIENTLDRKLDELSEKYN